MAAAPVTILKVEPGAYVPKIARLNSGFSGSEESSAKSRK
jgi:hypothetical protein